MAQELISIIVPVYRTEQYLDRCIESIVSQTYKNLEIILVDDGSPDNCPQMCDEWAKKDNRIKVIHKENGGVASARNTGIENSTGEYIGFVDGDDYIEIDMYKTLIENLELSNAEISVCGYHINDETDVNANIRDVSQFDALKKICMGDYKYGVLWNKLYKREVVNGIKMPSLKCCEDLLFNYYTFKNAKIIVECDSKLYHYMQNESSIVHGSFSIGAFDAVYSKEMILKEEKNTELEDYAVRGLISSCFVVLSGVIQSGKFKEKYEYLRNYIVKYKKTIFKSNLYTGNDKIKTFLLWLFPSFYNYLIERKHR